MKKETVTQVDSLGIDISKLTIDAFLYHRKEHRQFSNKLDGYKAMFKWISSLKIEMNSLVICFEHTGWYCLNLSRFLNNKGIDFHCVNPLEIKRSMGFKRGKTDKTDAFEIARYAWLHRDELVPSPPMPECLIELQRMMSLRDQLVKQSTALKNQQKGMSVIVKNESNDFCLTMITKNLKHLVSQIASIEKAMDLLLKQEQKLNKQYKLCKTVKGVGRILAVQMLIHTHGFSRFENSRQFSAYSGIVPYPYQSGTSINGRNKTHSIADIKMKSLLSIAAISAIQHDSELKIYYEKRVAEGKNKMLVLNIIRNKIVSRIFATVKRGTPYVEMNKFAA